MSIEDRELAKTLAIKYHAGQRYGYEVYTNHLQAVADSVAEGTTDERLVIVAWLHDILEDTTCSETLLRTLFEDNVVDAVVAMTKFAGEERGDYLIRLKKNQMARMVKMHDTFCNLRASLMRFDAKRVRKYSDQLNFLVQE